MPSTIWRIAGLLAALQASFVSAEAAAEAVSKTITKDVVIVGGGASGAHAAVRLREDFGKSIVLIEKHDYLGGHTETYIDPKTGIPYDYGVNSFIDYGGAKKFFSRFNITLVPPIRLLLNSTYADFDTGNKVSYIGPAADARTAALKKYVEIYTKYESLMLPSYWKWPAGKDIPEDLTMNFGDLVKKYNLEAAVPQIYQVTAIGVGDILNTPALTVMQTFNGPLASAFVGGPGTLVPESRKNNEIYTKIGALLGKDVMLSSTVVSSTRTNKGVEVVVKAKNGERIRIKAKKLLLAIEPTLKNLEPFDLDAPERNVFSKWTWTTEYCGVISHPSLPINGSVINTPANSDGVNWLSTKPDPVIQRFDYMGSNSPFFRVVVVGSQNTDSCESQKMFRRAIKKLIKQGTLPQSKERVKIHAYGDHGPMHLRVTAKQLREGFITQQYELMGRRSTWWTGAAWSAHFTTVVWEFNEQMLPKMVKSM